MNPKDYYKIFGIAEDSSEDSSEEVIKAVYRAHAKRFHPDVTRKLPAEQRKAMEERFKEITEANEVLSNPEKRAQYDRLRQIDDPHPEGRRQAATLGQEFGRVVGNALLRTGPGQRVREVADRHGVDLTGAPDALGEAAAEAAARAHRLVTEPKK
jgi:DnaJ-class molecular chaperone